MNIHTVIIEKFKGIQSMVIDADGKNLTVCGDNATGKTSVADAVFWLLDGKDANGRADFEIKPLDERGKPVPMQDHSVELVIDHNGQTIRLKKTLSELWIKAKGSAKSEFSGHKTTYAVNGIPVPKKEFDGTIASVCDPGLLRMLMDPLYFSSKLPWQPRRAMVMNLCDEPGEADVIAANKRLEPLEAYRVGQSIENFRKQIAARKAVINNELKAIPVRVDEVARTLPKRGDLEPASVKNELFEARQELDELEVKLRNATPSGGDGAVSEKRLRLVDNKRNLELLQKSFSDAHAEAERLTKQALKLDAELVQRREEWAQVDAEAFESTDTGTCMTCGQDLPPTLQAAANEKAQAAFTADKDGRLAAITSAGKIAASHLVQLQNRRQGLQQTMESLKPQIGILAESIEKLRVELMTTEKAPAHFARENETAELSALRDELRQRVDELARRDALATQIQAGEERIAQLKQQETKLAEEYADLEQQTFLAEEFMRTKVRLLEESIKSRFKLARFRLFEQQVNGALNDVCEVLGPDLVPYNAGLNHAAQINTGIDIINTLSEHYGFSAPIFIDNAEAVTQLIDTPAQVIRLVVAEGVKELQVVEEEGKVLKNGLENLGKQIPAKNQFNTFLGKTNTHGNKASQNSAIGEQFSLAQPGATQSKPLITSSQKGPGF